MGKFRKLIKKYYISLIGILPINNNKAVFCNFCGRGFGDNPKYIAEELHKKAPDVKIVWLTSESNDDFPSYIRPVKVGSLRRFFDINTAHVVVSNVRVNMGLKKRNGQIYLQTWHAPFSPKLLEAEAGNRLTDDYIEDAKYDGFITDGIISNSSLLDAQYKRAFWLNEKTEILRIGLPRNDFLINSSDDKKICEAIRNKLHLSSDDYIVLYAPTFRDDYSTEGYQIDFEAVLKAFENRFNKRCILLIKLHPNAREQVGYIRFSNNIIDVTKYPDVQELAVISDAVISDYSSVVFDFAMTDKTVFICTLDLQHYIETRGLLDEFYLFPFPCASDNGQLIENILNFDETKYRQKLEDYFMDNPIYDKGDASQKAADWILKKMCL